MIRDHLNLIGGKIHGAFSPDGALVVTGNRNRDLLLVSDARTGAKIAVLHANDPGVFTLAYSAEGMTLFCGGSNGAFAWDMSRINAFDGDRAVYLAAALDCGVGRQAQHRACVGRWARWSSG